MNELNTQLKLDDLQRAEETTILTVDELALVGGGECVLNGV